MTGQWIERVTTPPHSCAPPMETFGGLDGPAGLPGSVWECDCGQRWEVASSLIYEMSLIRGGPLGPAWRRQEATP